MKKCEYCAKEISYHEMYCNEECEKGAKRYYDLRLKYEKLFAVINGVFVIAIGIFIFLYSFLKSIAAVGAGASLMILGVMYIVLPFPPDVMIQKRKLKKSITITRYIGLTVFLIGVVVLILSFCGVL